MAGTLEGGLKACVTNKRRYGADYYQRLAYKSQEAWKKNGRKPRGFAANRERARLAGAKGGRISRRGSARA